MNFELREQDCNCKRYVVLILEWKQHGTALQFCFSDCRLLRPDFNHASTKNTAKQSESHRTCDILLPVDAAVQSASGLEA